MLTLRFFPLWYPALVSCLLSQWRSQQAFWRSQCFHTGRVLNSPAPVQDKLRRLYLRQGADQLALLHDCSEAQFTLVSVWSTALGQERRCRPWARIVEDFQGRMRTIWLRTLVDTGRATLAAPGHRP